jgi:hypothetical protein
MSPMAYRLSGPIVVPYSEEAGLRMHLL